MNTPLEDVPATMIDALFKRETELRSSGEAEPAERVASLRKKLRGWLEVRRALLTIVN